MVAGLIWIATDLRETRWIEAGGPDLAWVASILTLYAGISMVSNAPFWSGKSIDLKRRVPFIVVIAIMMGFVLVSADPPLVLFSLFLAYGLSGWVLWGWRVYHGQMAPRVLREDDD